MSTALTELIQQLQEFNARYADDAARVVVAVPTAPGAPTHFEVGGVRHDGPALVSSCRPVPEEEARPPAGDPRPEQARPCCHNDYENLC